MRLDAASKAAGIFITTPVVSAEQGTIAIKSEIKNDASGKVTMELTYSIYGPDGYFQAVKKRYVVQHTQDKSGDKF